MPVPSERALDAKGNLEKACERLDPTGDGLLAYLPDGELHDLGVMAAELAQGVSDEKGRRA